MTVKMIYSYSMNSRQRFTKLIESLPDARVRHVNVGAIWTAVVVDVNGVLQGGLAATMRNPDYMLTRLPAVERAGSLEEMEAHTLAGLVTSDSHTEASIGLAAINALLPRSEHWGGLHAVDFLTRQSDGKRLAIVGHFSFVEQLRRQGLEPAVLELEPLPGDLPAEAAARVLPQSDVIVITATTLINNTFDGLIALCPPHAHVMLLGPSTPLSPQLFDWGLDSVAGTLVTDPLYALQMTAQGGGTRQMKSALRQVSLLKE